MRLVYTKTNQNEYNTHSGNDLGYNKIDYRIANPLSNTKKISSRASFSSSIASLAFI